jgi:hypothetical protein
MAELSTEAKSSLWFKIYGEELTIEMMQHQPKFEDFSRFELCYRLGEGLHRTQNPYKVSKVEVTSPLTTKELSLLGCVNIEDSLANAVDNDE